jgi:hypothetical protein
MAECRIAKSCPFYTGQAIDSTAAISKWLRDHYCQGNSAICARHTIHEAIGQEFVPADLYPNEQVRAFQILSQANRHRGWSRKLA